jgi:hypothetical protein
MISVLLKELETGCKVPKSAGDLSVLCCQKVIFVVHVESQIDVHYSLPRDDNLAKGGEKNQVWKNPIFLTLVFNHVWTGVARNFAGDLA